MELSVRGVVVAEQSNREKEIFEGALDRAAGEERQRYIEIACADDKVLLTRIRALLQAHDAGEDFLPEEPGPPPGVPKFASFLSAQLTEKPGDTIGPYKLREKLGEGGCGVVYLAEQEQPVKRKVALKIIKLGMDTRQVVARFEAERQALAMMDHTNIAKVLEAGATVTGRPYFVMELVGGIKITDYCEQNHLDTEQRLDLFIQVCRAVQHAHQKGVIHRDIKPSNVLVATQDGVSIPKVIDFGIAKATQGKLTDETVFTAFEQFLGTPAYMSPEQTQPGGLDVDTRSDIYSLGVLLYELLTGKTPFDAKELLAAGLEAMRRTILEKEPPTPSTRLKLETAQRVQGSSGSKIKNQKSKVANDLDWIVMKCLEKDRARRYETANGLAMDIERHLNNEPVVAGPPSKLYVFRKTVQRNRTAFAAAAAVAVVLLLGVLVSTWQAFRATAAERRSNKNAVKSQQVADFLKEMLASVGPSKALGRDTTMLREVLDKTAARIGKDLTNQPEVEIELRATLAATYRELGLYKEMKELAEQNLSLARARLGGEHLLVAASLDQLGSALGELGKYSEAEGLQRQALALRRRFLGQEHLLVAESLENIAHVIAEESKLAEVARLAEAEAMNREALAIRRKLLGNEHQDVAASLNDLAIILQDERKLEEAEVVQREGLALQQKLLGNEHPDVATSLNNLASLLLVKGKLHEAETMHRQALALRRKLMGNDHPQVANSLDSLALVLLQEGKSGEAEALEREALSILRKFLGDQHPDLIEPLDNVARLLMGQGRLAEAEAIEREAVAIERKTPGKIDVSLANLALLLRNQGKLAEAQDLLEESVARRRKRQDPELESALAQLADVLLAEEKFKEAEPVARECLAIREKRVPDWYRTFNMSRLVGESLLGQQNYPEAEPFLRSGYEGLKQREDKIPVDSRAWIRDTIEDLIRLYESTERPDKVVEWNAELTQWYARAAERFRRAAESGEPEALNNVAWLLATCVAAAVRDGTGAVAYAEKAVAATNRKEPGFLDTLAAACAEAGEYAKAVSIEKEAIALVPEESLRKDLETHLKLYESNTPYRER
jgi:serine/threonine protein kinase/tetratricopeptide (TPR) repeat protein